MNYFRELVQYFHMTNLAHRASVSEPRPSVTSERPGVYEWLVQIDSRNNVPALPSFSCVVAGWPGFVNRPTQPGCINNDTVGGRGVV